MPVTTMSPRVAHLGETTKLTFAGDLDAEVADGNFNTQVAFSSNVPLLDCQGDASVKKTCNFPLRTGSLTVHDLNFPIKASYGGSIENINMDLDLSDRLPTWLLSTTTLITYETKSGETIFCVVLRSQGGENGAVTLNYKDCGDAEAHAHITGLTPSSVPIGKTTKLTWSAKFNKDVSDGTFSTHTSSRSANLLDHCTGDDGKSKTCSLKSELGSVTFDPPALPWKKGSNSVSLDVSLSSSIPSAFIQAATRVSAFTESGDQIFCMQVYSSPMMESNLNAPASANTTVATLV